MEAAKSKSSHPAKWCWDQLGGEENLARVYQPGNANRETCAPLGATSEDLSTKTVVPRFGHELPNEGALFGVPRKPPFQARVC